MNCTSNMAVNDAIADSDEHVIKPVDDDHHHHGMPLPKKNRRRRSMDFFRAALYMLPHKPVKQETVIQVDGSSNRKWKRFVGSMRPLHLDGNHSSDPLTPTKIENPTPAAAAVNDEIITTTRYHEQVVEEVYKTPPLSPAPDDYLGSISSSKYASAVNLQELDKDDDDEQKKDAKNNGDPAGDELIDAKADEFIAQFYEQMRVQNETYADRG